MLDRKCNGCAAPATVEMNLVLYCGKCAYEKVTRLPYRMASK